MRAFSKEVVRSITKSWGRFLAIAVMAALGCGFYAGLRMTGPDMRLAGDAYFDATDQADLRVVSMLGLSDEQVSLIEGVEGVEGVMPARQADAISSLDGVQYTLRFHSLDVDAARASSCDDGLHVESDDANYLNRPILVQGRWPSAEDECLLSADEVWQSDVSVGDVVELIEGTDDLDATFAVKRFTVTGFVHSSSYACSTNTGSTSLGSGELSSYVYVSEGAFASDLPYTEAFITVAGARDLAWGSDAYDEKVDEVQARLEDLAGRLSALRVDQLTRDAQSELDGERAELDRQKADAQAQLAQAQSQLDAAKSQLDVAAAQAASGKAQYAQGQQGYAQGQADYESGLARYEQGLSELDEQRAQAEERFADAEAQLADGQAQIDAIADKDASVYVLDRSKNIGAESYRSDAGRIDQIAQVFPLMFFLVAALVSLTTMTRMVEEERVLIGTFKALGYSSARITSKYLVYAVVASGVGAIVGIALFSQFLPWFIMKAYSIMYAVPCAPTPIDVGLALMAALLGVGINVAATWFAAAATLRERPAALMLPRAPKAGKRILLERIRPIWGRLSFSWKVTARNLFRYKRRFLMAVVGIAGCTALLLTGLGLQNAINDIIDKQYGGVFHFNTIVRMDSDASDAERAAVSSAVGDQGDASTWVSASNKIAVGQGGAEHRVELVAAADAEALEDFVTLRTRVGHASIALDDDGAVISEKLASQLGLSVGDSVELYDEDAIGNLAGAAHEVRIDGIMENYVGQYVYLTASGYERIFGASPAFSTLYATLDGGVDRDAFSDEVLALDDVKTVTYNDETIDSYRTMLKTVDSVVVVLVVAAALLAFVVLYNLTNINITERAREIATLKVLGFTPREVNAYIFRETMLLAVIGALVGMVLGVVMEGFVITTAEVDQVMFGRDIHATSFVIAFVLTMAFSCVVAWAMRGKLRRIGMVESLKSNE